MTLVYLTLTIVLIVFGYYRCSSIMNPATLVGIFFGIPTIFASMELSSFQIGWTDKAHYILVTSLIIWVCTIFFYKKKKGIENLPSIRIPLWVTPVWLILYQLETFLLGGTPFGLVVDIHTASFPVLSIITRSFAVVLMVCYGFNIINRKYLVYSAVFLTLIIVSFLSRYTRIDIVMGLGPTLVIVFDRFIKSKNWKLFTGFATILLLIGIGASFLQQYRWSRGGMYDVDLVEVTQYEGYVDSFNLLPTLYSNFCLGIENLDYTIRNSERLIEPRYGILSLDWLFRGFLKLHYFAPDFFPDSAMQDYRYNHTGAGTVATYLEIYIYDYGTDFYFIPLIFYCALITWAYNNNRSLYSIFMGCIILFAFQSLIVSPRVWFSLLFFIIVLRLWRDPSFARNSPSPKRSIQIIKSEHHLVPN